MPTNRQLFLNHLGQTSTSPMMLEIERAEGIFLYGPSGERYFDLISGVNVSNTGHGNTTVTDAVIQQVSSYMHLMVYGEMIQSPQVRYATFLSSLLPSTLSSCYFVNSGSEAVEGALKLAKRYTGKSRIVSFINAYHGSTHGALSVQGSETYRNSFRPLLPGIFFARFNDIPSLDVIDNDTACVIVEPVQGEAGIILPDTFFLSKIRERCNKTGALLVFDEIQTGFGRTGKMFAFEHYNVTPDILLLAKSLGGGMPLGAFISSPEIMNSLTFNPVLGHITTFGGHPVSCAAGLASAGFIIENNLAYEATEKEALFRHELQHPLIKEVRGKGLMLAVELGNPELVFSAVALAPQFGLVIDFFLFCTTAIRIAPPLTITNDEIVEACSQFRKMLDHVMTGNKS